MSFLSREDARAAGYYSRRNRDRVPQDKARATYFAFHGPQGRRENAKERDEARAKRSDHEQLRVIARRIETNKDKGVSSREVTRLSLRIAAATLAAQQPQEAAKPVKQNKGKPHRK